MDIVNINELGKLFDLSERDVKKYVLRVSNNLGVKIMNEAHGSTYVEPFTYDNVVEALDYYKSFIPLRETLNNNQWDVVPFTNGSYIYFLMNNKEVVYIGQSINIAYRTHSHLKDKDFDSIYYIEVPREDRMLIESICIQDFNPKYNEQSMEKYLMLIEILNNMF